MPEILDSGGISVDSGMPSSIFNSHHLTKRNIRYSDDEDDDEDDEDDIDDDDDLRGYYDEDDESSTPDEYG